MRLTGLLVDLDGSPIGLNSNDLANEILMTNTDLLGLVLKGVGLSISPTNSYMAHPIMFAAIMTGLG